MSDHQILIGSDFTAIISVVKSECTFWRDMPRPRSPFTEDIEFRTGLDRRGNVVRRGRFVRRPRRVGGRTVPGNARYYRRRQQELLAGRRAAQRAASGRDRTRAVGRRAGRAAGNARAAGGGRPARQVASRSSGRRVGRIRRGLARAARAAANLLERRRSRRR